MPLWDGLLKNPLAINVKKMIRENKNNTNAVILLLTVSILANKVIEIQK